MAEGSCVLPDGRGTSDSEGKAASVYPGTCGLGAARAEATKSASGRSVLNNILAMMLVQWVRMDEIN